MAGCLVGCIGTYKAGEIKLPEDGHTLAPWVKIRLIKGGKEITVSNLSSPPDNTVVVKDFEFGMADSSTCQIVLHDTAGSSLVAFMKDLIVDFKDLAAFAGNTMEVSWGWTKSGCVGAAPDPCKSVPYPHTLIIDSIEQSFNQGKFTYIITGKGLCSRAPEARAENIKGQENKLKRLRMAIQELWTSGDEKPKINTVKIGRFNPKWQDCGFKDHKDGPESVWIPEGRNKLQVTREWLSRWPSDRDRGWNIVEDTTEGGGTLLIVEDGKPICNEPEAWDAKSIGTYIINGSKCSPVIEFNPKFRWDFVALVNAAGGIGDGKPMLNAEKAEHPGHTDGRLPCKDLKRSESDNKGAGNTKPVVDSEDLRRQGGSDRLERGDHGQERDTRAAKVFHDQINADLVVVGDPLLPAPRDGMWSRNLATAFINPFHLMGPGGGCPEWIARPTCNEILSNKAWMLKSITHKIQAGRYTSTISVYLTTPGIDIDLGQPMGGQGSQGWVIR